MSEPTTMNIYQKLAKIRKSVEIIKKDKKAYGYNYTSEEAIMAKVTTYMEKYNLSLIPQIVPGTTNVAPYTYKKTKTTNKGEVFEENVNEVLVTADLTWTWINNDNPEEQITIPWTMVGQQSDASQSFGSGLTYSSRYFLLKFFNISTSNDDPDAFRTRQREAEDEERKFILAEIIENVDKTIRGYLADNPDQSAAVKKLVTKYVKSGDYFAIHDIALASKLYKDVCSTFNIAEKESE